MNDRAPTNVWLYGLLYLCLAGGTLFVHLLPLSTSPTRWAAPDVMLCLTYVWVLRRPSFVPIALIALVFLIFDMFLLRPPGLMTAYVVVGAEFLRGRARVNHELPFLVEWALVAGVMSAVLLGYRLTLFLVAIDLPTLGLSLQHLIGTLLLYPVFVVVSERVIHIDTLSGQTDGSGKRP
jgi:rod shape-determining protein MreD